MYSISSAVKVVRCPMYFYDVAPELNTYPSNMLLLHPTKPSRSCPIWASTFSQGQRKRQPASASFAHRSLVSSPSKCSINLPSYRALSWPFSLDSVLPPEEDITITLFCCAIYHGASSADVLARGMDVDKRRPSAVLESRIHT
ncbi:hypothetical protein M404DRAFT_999454 [Pisolithus tinctorius Marx 270]|uniref:Uncharacterized protein n=1 Tax=Pisolithus tinctorius Marx 270 TaxID=870435 RepID=A0A0C3NZH0_PISTI|nr:hypothetical protein M404DRAFT_999454 [Pisolithus tinctorius Marx 270]